MHVWTINPLKIMTETYRTMEKNPLKKKCTNN